MTKKKEDGYDNLLPTRIREMMKKREMNIKGLSEKTGIIRQSIGYYSDGSNLPNAENLAKIAKALDVSADYLLGLSDDEKPKTSQNFEKCIDAIRFIDALLTIKGSFYTYNPPEEMVDGYSDPSISITISDQGIVNYYRGIERVNDAVKGLPDSVRVSAWQFQYDATKKLLEEAEKTKLNFTGFVQISEDEIGF